MKNNNIDNSENISISHSTSLSSTYSSKVSSSINSRHNKLNQRDILNSKDLELHNSKNNNNNNQNNSNWGDLIKRNSITIGIVATISTFMITICILIFIIFKKKNYIKPYVRNGSYDDGDDIDADSDIEGN